MFIFLAFRTKAKKLNLPAAKFYHFLLGCYKKRFDSIIQPNHVYDKFPAVFSGIMLDHFLLESDPEKNLIEGSGSFTVMPAPGGHPASLAKNFWIPAFAGMTGLHEETPAPCNSYVKFLFLLR